MICPKCGRTVPDGAPCPCGAPVLSSNPAVNRMKTLGSSPKFLTAAILCSVTVLGVPATSPETPLSLYSLRDTLIRVGWRQLGQEQFIISRTAGADQNGEPADQNGEGQP